MKIAIAGASGLIGTALTSHLKEQGHTVLILSREQGTDNVFWNPYDKKIELDKLEGIDCAVCLSGENIASGRWTSSKKERLIKSRVETNDFLIESITKLKDPPKTYLSASAIGIYKPSFELQDESGEIGTAFISEICKLWEATSHRLPNNIRSVQTRIGIVLSKNGGALEKMLLPFSLGLGAYIGDGKQYMSWISLDDVVRAFAFCIENSSIEGPVNLTSTNPATNKEFSKTLAKALNRPCLVGAPAFLIKLLLGEMGEQLLLQSTRIQPKKLLDAGFSFEDTDLLKTFQKILN